MLAGWEGQTGMSITTRVGVGPTWGWMGKEEEDVS